MPEFSERPDLVERIADLGYRAGWSLTRHLPGDVSADLFDRAARIAFRRRGPRTIQLAKNLRRVLGDDAAPTALAAVTLAGMRSYARYWQETFRLPAMDHDEVLARSVAGTYGLDHVEAGLAAGNGVILCLPHSGNWDIAGLMISKLFGGLVTVNERLKPEAVYRRFVDYRTSLGFEVLPLTGGETSPYTTIGQRLAENKVVCLLGDRTFGAGGIDVQFFGETTKMPSGPMTLAIRSNAAILPVHLSFSDTGWLTEIQPPVVPAGTRLREQVTAGTRQLADFFADRIAAYPADWHMLQPFWPSDFPKDQAGERI